MSQGAIEKGRAASGGLATRNANLPAKYHLSSDPSRASRLEQAAVVLLLLLRHRLTPVERTAYVALLERRLRRVYGGLSR